MPSPKVANRMRQSTKGLSGGAERNVPAWVHIFTMIQPFPMPGCFGSMPPGPKFNSKWRASSDLPTGLVFFDALTWL